MRKTLLRLILKFLLRLRYSIKISGLNKIHNDQRGILFLPNHPALIDPLIVLSLLQKKYNPRPLVAEDQLARPGIQTLMQPLNPIIIPDLTLTGSTGKTDVHAALNQVVSALQKGENVVVYPSGRIYRSQYEDLGGKSGVEQVLARIPDVRIVLIRTQGLWGSSFSKASGQTPHPEKLWKKYLLTIILHLIFFTPKRRVTVDMHEPADIPRTADRISLNSYLESFYNMNVRPNTFVPYYPWQGRKPRVQPEPKKQEVSRDASHIPENLKQQVTSYIQEITGISKVLPENSLSRDLGMDSLATLELIQWIEREFGMPQQDMEALQTVQDCFLAASGEIIGTKTSDELQKISSDWLKPLSSTRRTLPPATTISEAFLCQARKYPGKVLLADRLAGSKTYRQLVMAILALQPELKKLPGSRLGIMLPSTVTAVITYLSVMFSEKTPVMVNWTVGEHYMNYSLNNTGVTHVITARALIDKLKKQGFNPDHVRVTWIYLEDYKQILTLGKKLKALYKSYFSWSSLKKAHISDTAAILFTSGSEANPKAVPLSHTNILTNIKDLAGVINIRPDYRLLGMLPAFHSLGLTCTIILPLTVGIKTVYHANPTEPVILAQLIEQYKASLVISTPTFVQGIIRAATVETLASLRLIITGAEKCPDYVYNALHTTCPEAVICEGYGITECSPVVSVNHVEDSQPGTIGHILPSMKYCIVNPDTMQRIAPGEQGMLLVKGENVFSGYLSKDAKSPFVKCEGETWYSTGDLVYENSDGTITFAGRLKRFIKLGGEMISLPAIEQALLPHYSDGNDEGIMLAVEATPSEDHPEIVLFTTVPTSREQANTYIRQEGLSALHSIRKIIEIDNIPVLGTGKTDYKQLKTQLKI